MAHAYTDSTVQLLSIVIPNIFALHLLLLTMLVTILRLSWRWTVSGAATCIRGLARPPIAVRTPPPAACERVNVLPLLSDAHSLKRLACDVLVPHTTIFAEGGIALGVVGESAHTARGSSRRT
jgi:hypothetical protein